MSNILGTQNLLDQPGPTKVALMIQLCIYGAIKDDSSFFFGDTVGICLVLMLADLKKHKIDNTIRNE